MIGDREAYSYRTDPAVPQFDETRPLFVFDGYCALCSGGASVIMRLDRNGRIAFTPAAGPLGTALYEHYGLAIEDTYLFVLGGQAYGLSEGYFRVVGVLGGVWSLVNLLRLVPECWRDHAYCWIAANRYRLLGRRDHCSLLTEEQRSRLLGVVESEDAPSATSASQA